MNDSFHIGGKTGREFYNGAMFDFVRSKKAVESSLLSKGTDANCVVYPAGRQLVVRSLAT